MIYSAKVYDTTSRMRSTRWNEPNTTTSEIKTPASAELTQGGISINDPAAEMPAYSVQIVPKFANSNPTTAK